MFLDHGDAERRGGRQHGGTATSDSQVGTGEAKQAINYLRNSVKATVDAYGGFWPLLWMRRHGRGRPVRLSWSDPAWMRGCNLDRCWGHPRVAQRPAGSRIAATSAQVAATAMPDQRR
jgi:hypothetical protein